MTSNVPFSYDRDNFPQYNDTEYHCMLDMASAMGELAALALFRDSPLAQQLAAVRAYLLMKAPTVFPPLPASPRSSGPKPLKVPIHSYSGSERENLPRWFLEIEMALHARQIDSDDQKVVFMIAHLAGRARAWAFSNAMLNQGVFPDYEELKRSLRESFQPPKSEFRTRQTFLAIKQGKRSLYDYVQEARSLVADITQDPMDQATQVSVFLSGLRPGPVRAQLFRAYPTTLDAAANMAMQEDFASRQSEVPGQQFPKPFKTHHPPQDEGPTPMEICSTETRSRGNAPSRDLASIRCFKCDKMGHYARDCRVRGAGGANGNASSQRGPGRRSGRPGYQKNGHRQ